MSPLAWRAYLGAGALAAGVVLALPVAPRAVLLVAVGASAALAIVARGPRPPAGRRRRLVAAGRRAGAVRARRRAVHRQRPGPAHRALPVAGRRPVPGGLPGAGGWAGAAPAAPFRHTGPAGAAGRRHHRHRVRPHLLGAGGGPLLPRPRADPAGAGGLARLPGGTRCCWRWPPPSRSPPAGARRPTGCWSAPWSPTPASLSWRCAAPTPAPPTSATWSPTRCWGRPPCTRPWSGCRNRRRSGAPASASTGCWRWALVAPALLVVQRLQGSRVDAELHDGPIQRLTALAYELEHAKQQLLRASPQEGTRRLERAQAALSAEVQGPRQLMVSLRPPRQGAGDGGLPHHPGGAAQRGQARPGGTAVARPGGDRRARAPGDPRRRGRLPAGAELGAGPRRPRRPGRHARAGGDGRGSWQVHARPGGGVTIRARFRTRSAA
jgi:hypothetical protein